MVSTPAVSRRLFLATLAAIGAPACARPGDPSARGGSGADPFPSATPGTRTSTSMTTSTRSPADVVRRKLERLTYGVTPGLLAEVGDDAALMSWLDAQLAAPVAMTADPTARPVLDLVEANIASLTTAAAGAGDDTKSRNRARRGLTESIAARVVAQAALGPDQVRQRLVDVFAEHLHVTSAQAPDVYFVAAYDEMLRAHVLGRFSDLLIASAQSPAMLLFLDNATSRADGDHRPNENYARELLELHTVGVDGGYDEGDVVEVAHVFSGWSLAKREAATGARPFAVRPAWHDLGPLATGGDVLGWRPPTGGSGSAASIELTGRSLLDHLARHPATARRIAHLLARRFVSDTIPADDPIIDAAASAYLDHDTSIPATLRTLLTHERFADAATLMVRRPVDLVASLVRCGGIALDASRFAEQGPLLVAATSDLGQLPYGWAAPDGAPTASAAWATASAFIGRWNTVASFADHPALGLPADRIAEFCGPDGQLY